MNTDILHARAGASICVCPPGKTGRLIAPERRQTALITLAFGLSVLMQALSLSVMPLAGVMTAPQAWLSTMPYMLLLTGAAAATFPASLLIDSFGRRAAFALGASLGFAGGLMAAYGFYRLQFAAVCLGSFWLGAAQGFGFYYRHLAYGTVNGSDAGSVLSGGVLAALLAPAILHSLLPLSGQFTASYVFVAASLTGILTLTCTIGLRDSVNDFEDKADGPCGDSPALWRLSLSGAFAWFVMSFLMAAGPGRLSGCNIGLDAASGVIAVHLLAMYGPAAFLGRFLTRFGLSRTMIFGLSMLLLACFIPYYIKSVNSTPFSMVFGGIGWSMVMLGTSAALGMKKRLSRYALAFNDCLLYLAAIAGAFFAPFVFSF